MSSEKALIVCDMQIDLLQSITPEASRQQLVDFIYMAITAAHHAGWRVIFTGVQFEPGYPHLAETHKVYGGFKRLWNIQKKAGNLQSKQWFVKGQPGAEIEASLLRAAGEHAVFSWRQGLVPSFGSVLDCLTQVAIVGIKASYAVQAVCQVVCDQGISVSIIQECVQDDIAERRIAVLEQLLPIYGTVVSLRDFILDLSDGDEDYSALLPPPLPKKEVLYVSNCGRGGHGPLYMAHLLERAEWREFPLQPWYSSGILGTGKQYMCPLGKSVVDFCDEPQFSRSVSMFLKGREWLDEKDKLLEIAREWMPETYIWRNGEFDQTLPKDETGPWFVKQVDENGGRAIDIFASLKPAVDLLGSERSGAFVLQRHLENPQLDPHGRKSHLKCYNLLTCDKGKWELYFYRDAFLCSSPNKWSRADLQPPTQITTRRDKRIRLRHQKECKQHSIECSDLWSLEECMSLIANVVFAAIQKGKLTERTGKKQFEIFSADLMMDTSKKLWLIEFNFSPVLYDPIFFTEEKLTTPGLKAYHERYHQVGDDNVNDRPMVKDALSLVFDGKLLKESGWILCKAL